MSALFDYSVMHYCKRRDVACLDHWVGYGTDSYRPVVNRICLTCHTHWYGDAQTAVFEIPARTWDRWMQESLA